MTGCATGDSVVDDPRVGLLVFSSFQFEPCRLHQPGWRLPVLSGHGIFPLCNSVKFCSDEDGINFTQLGNWAWTFSNLKQSMVFPELRKDRKVTSFPVVSKKNGKETAPWPLRRLLNGLLRRHGRFQTAWGCHWPLGFAKWQIWSGVEREWDGHKDKDVSENSGFSPQMDPF